MSYKYWSISKLETVACHDMMNGYIKDNFFLFKNELKNKISFRFRHFMNTDIFIYFSHHGITIPPYSYIKVAHQLGNKILGTVIAEFNA